jgi:hypothetical protein
MLILAKTPVMKFFIRKTQASHIIYRLNLGLIKWKIYWKKTYTQQKYCWIIFICNGKLIIDMKVVAAYRTAAVVIFFSLFAACSDVDIGTLYSPNGSYQVRALVNGNSLESCSIVRSDDKIQPYFAASVINDPDLVGLLVYLQNPRGEIIGDKTRYLLHIYADEADLEAASTENEENSEITAPEFEENDDEITQTGEEIEDMPTVGADWVDSNEKLVIVKSFDNDLPYFSIPQNLEPGLYSLIFEAQGRRNTLSRTETDIYYLGNIEFNLKDISLYLPGVSSSQLILPEATVLLEVNLDFDKRLDPYVIWYRGKNIVSEGRLSEGAGSLLWKAPEQAGIYSMRIEAFPLRLRSNLTGIFRDISLPVSPKAVTAGYFYAEGPKYTSKSSLTVGTSYPELVKQENAKTLIPTPIPELLQWYQFNGDLRDSTLPLADERQLVSVYEKDPHWEAVQQSYGLSIGSDESFSVSPINFIKTNQDQGGGIFLFHLRPISEGEIFNIFFPSQLSPTEGAWISVIGENNSVVLCLNTNGQVIKTPIYINFQEAQAFIPVVVEFYIRPNSIEAKLSLGEDILLQHEAVGIRLSDPLTGEGRITIGTAHRSTKPPTSTEPPLVRNIRETEDVPDNTMVTYVEQTNALTTVWNEFAILMSGIPLLPDELPETTEQDVLNPTPIIALSTTEAMPLREASPPSDSRIDNTETDTYPENELTDEQI